MNINELDKKNIWHPFTQMKTAPTPISVVKAKGSYLYTQNGERYLDAISSWWVNPHGHCHPYIVSKIQEQVAKLEQVIFADFTHPKAVELSEKLLNVLPVNQAKVFFSDNGSTAVEIGLKMAFQYWYNIGKTKTKIIALEGAYHGDTFGAMSVGANSPFNEAFQPFLFDVLRVDVFSESDKLITDFEQIIKNKEVAAFVYEPLLQGAAGMRMYAPELLETLLKLCKKYDVLAIADEVMTGFGRTGKLFASEYMTTPPDIMCFSKGLTGGFLPMGVTTCSQQIFDAFYSNDKLKTFFHGHSFTANAIGCAAACASLDLFAKKETWKQIKMISEVHQQQAEKLQKHPKVQNLKMLGTVISFELITDENTSYLNNIREFIYDFFISKNLLLRPLGNVIYILPLYCISQKELLSIYDEIYNFLEK